MPAESSNELSLLGGGGENATEWDEMRIDFAKYNERHKMFLSSAQPETLLGLIGRSPCLLVLIQGVD